MAKYVPDVKTHRWVIISATRIKRPEDFGNRAIKKKTVCPFCAGNEGETPPEVYRIGDGEKDKPGWRVRVVPNKYMITDVHEVIIHNPSHTHDIAALPREAGISVVTAYRDRYRAHEDDGQVLIFCNSGKQAGASLLHPHSQLVVIPKQINLDTLEREPITNLVRESEKFRTYCPDFSQWPFETWIAPKEEGSRFGDLNDADIPQLTDALQKALRNIEAISKTPLVAKFYSSPTFEYNFYLYHGANWYVRIIPRFIQRAGFELGTGLSVNIVDPAEAAHALKTIDGDNRSSPGENS